MLICLGDAHVDLDQAKNLLKWCSELDGQQQAHQLLLVASSRVSGPDTSEMLELGRRCFTGCRTRTAGRTGRSRCSEPLWNGCGRARHSLSYGWSPT